MYDSVYALLPGALRDRYMKTLRYTDIKIRKNKFLGFLISFGAGLAFVIAFNAAILFSMSPLIFLAVFAGVYVLLEIVIYGMISLSVDSKARFVETVLPDALQLMAMNIRSGMTTDRALILASRPEFGPLQYELSKAGKKIMSGGDFRDSLLEIPKGIRSDILERTISLIVEGIQSGGEIAELLQQTAEDIRNTKIVEQEIRSSIMMYSIFIFFAAAIGSPLLFGISTFLVEMLSKQLSKFQISELQVQGMNIGKGGINVSSEFLLLFTFASLVITAVFGGLIMGIINRGDEKYGLRYIPALFIISMVVFVMARLFVGSIFSGL